MLKLEKGMYSQARVDEMTFSELLEKQAPSKKEGLDAFQFALYDRDINLKKHTVERFYRTAEDSILFPEFINRNVRVGIAGLSARDLTLADIVATETNIDSGVYETVNAQFNAKKIDFKRVAEGAPFPSVTIETAKSSIRLAKIGVEMNVTYEVLRRMKLPLLSIHLQLIGKRLAKRMVAYAVYNLINGDGNDNAAPATAATVVNYDNLLDFFLDMDEWEATVWAAKAPLLKEIMHLAEFKDPRLFDTAATGALAKTFGHQIKKFNWAESALGDGLLLAIDKTASLEHVKEIGSELVETNKVIDRQFEKTVISQVTGFSRIFTNATNVFTRGQAQP